MDLNLVRVFVAVYETGGLTSAARRLFVTQPAVSQSLGRLRAELGDVLFVREGRRMRPTMLAERVYPGFRDAVLAVDRTLDDVHGFDPATSAESFRIAMSELGEIGWISAVMAAVRAGAPRARVEIVPMDIHNLADWLSRGAVDVALTPSPVAGPFERTLIKEQGYGLAMRRTHPLAQAELTIEDYRRAAHVAVASDSGAADLELARRRADVRIEPAVSVMHFASLPPLLAGAGGYVATVPDTIASGWAEVWPLVVRPLPYRMDAVHVRLYKRSTSTHRAAVDWLYDTVARAIRGSAGSFGAIHGDARATG